MLLSDDPPRIWGRDEEALASTAWNQTIPQPFTAIDINTHPINKATVKKASPCRPDHSSLESKASLRRKVPEAYAWSENLGRDEEAPASFHRVELGDGTVGRIG